MSVKSYNLTGYSVVYVGNVLDIEDTKVNKAPDLHPYRVYREGDGMK